MALTGSAGLQAGLRPPLLYDKVSLGGTTDIHKSLWACTGMPGAGGYDTTLNGVTCDSTTAGALYPWTNPVSGETRLARWELSGDHANSSFFLLDRIWHNGGYTITSTSAQNSTTPTWGARDANGSTNGDGVLLMLEVSATVGAATPTITVSYTNSAGTAGRTGVNMVTTRSAAGASSCYLISLQAGDTGVRSVESLTLSASWISGTINLVAFRPIAFVDGFQPSQSEPAVWDYAGRGAVKLYDSSCLFFMQNCNTTSEATIHGSINLAQG